MLDPKCLAIMRIMQLEQMSAKGPLNSQQGIFVRFPGVTGFTSNWSRFRTSLQVEKESLQEEFLIIFIVLWDFHYITGKNAVDANLTVLSKWKRLY